MVKRKCGTCQFFEDCDIAGSGWCTHPQRRDLHSMVLVRRSELACRNSWDQDLWQPGVVDDSPNVDNPAADMLDIPPPTVDDASIATIPQDGYTDKIQSIGVPLRRPPSPDRQDIPPAIADDFGRFIDAARDPKDAVRAAQRRRQAQLDAKRSGAPMPSAPAAARDIPAPHDDLPPIRAPRTDRVHREILIPPGIVNGLSRSSDAAEASEPPRDVPPRLAVESAAEPAQDVLAEAPHRKARGARQETDQLPSIDVREELVRQSQHPPRGSQPTLPREPVERRVDSPRVVQQPSDFADRRHEPAGERRIAQSSKPQPRPLPPANLDALPGVAAGRYGVTEATPERFMADPIDTDLRARALPRCCGTCRDFRRIGDGQQGWCENAYAFPKRRMVQSAELACRSSFGVWWLPYDEPWLERADITHHGRPTPMMDGMACGRLPGKDAMESREADR